MQVSDESVEGATLTVLYGIILHSDFSEPSLHLLDKSVITLEYLYT